MYHFLNKPAQSDQSQPQQELITVRPQVFNFSFSHTCQNPRSNNPHNPHNPQSHQNSHTEKVNNIRYKDSIPSSQTSLRDDTVWRPKLPAKRIFDQPRFLLSLERKKMRVINGMRGCQFQHQEVQRIQLKNLKKKNKKQQSCRPIKFSQPQKFPQNYTHTSLNLQSSQTHRISKTPYLNFNLHHIIKQRKQSDHHHPHPHHNQHQQSQGHHEIRDIPKTGSNLPYYALFKSERFDRTLRAWDNLEDTVGEGQSGRVEVRTAKAGDRNRAKFRFKNNKSTAQEKRVVDGQPQQKIIP